MATVIIIVGLAGVAAMIVWGISTRERREPDDRPFDLGGVEAGTPEFAIGPIPADEARPPRTWSVLRVAVFVTFLSGVVAALAWAVGVFVKARLDEALRVP